MYRGKWIMDGHKDFPSLYYAEFFPEEMRPYKREFQYLTLWGDKVSMLTHIYPHKPWREIKVTICKITRLTAHFVCGLMSDLLICTCL